MPSRKDQKKQKEKISQGLIKAALELCAEEGYASLSLRSVARKGGVAPTSFYCHFREIDEMGLAMVARAREVLNTCLAQAGKKMTFPAIKTTDPPALTLKSIECLSRPLAETFIRYFKNNLYLLYLFFQEKTGSSASMRAAIAEASDQLITLLTEDLKRLTKSSINRFGDCRFIAEVMLTVVSDCGMELFVHPGTKPCDILESTIKKLNLLLLGALMIEQGTEKNK